ncbi:hypothetical protein QBC39DRAFT_400958 [Podospora conica]|nr:hypothetical protein QBC39DRAFT_400958 [Schizothecium conicum]
MAADVDVVSPKPGCPVLRPGWGPTLVVDGSWDIRQLPSDHDTARRRCHHHHSKCLSADVCQDQDAGRRRCLEDTSRGIDDMIPSDWGQPSAWVVFSRIARFLQHQFPNSGMYKLQSSSSIQSRGHREGRLSSYIESQGESTDNVVLLLDFMRPFAVLVGCVAGVGAGGVCSGGVHRYWSRLKSWSPFGFLSFSLDFCGTSVKNIFPALDIIRSRPADAAHYEYSGLSKALLHLIFDADNEGILSSRAADEAVVAFRNFAFPIGWSQIPSVRRHIDSMNMKLAG